MCMECFRVYGILLCVQDPSVYAVSFRECQVFPCMKCYCVTLYSVAVGLVTTVEWYVGSLVCVVFFMSPHLIEWFVA